MTNVHLNLHSPLSKWVEIRFSTHLIFTPTNNVTRGTLHPQITSPLHNHNAKMILCEKRRFISLEPDSFRQNLKKLVKVTKAVPNEKIEIVMKNTTGKELTKIKFKLAYYVKLEYINISFTDWQNSWPFIITWKIEIKIKCLYWLQKNTWFQWWTYLSRVDLIIKK